MDLANSGVHHHVVPNFLWNSDKRLVIQPLFRAHIRRYVTGNTASRVGVDGLDHIQQSLTAVRAQVVEPVNQLTVRHRGVHVQQRPFRHTIGPDFGVDRVLYLVQLVA